MRVAGHYELSPTHWLAMLDTDDDTFRRVMQAASDPQQWTSEQSMAIDTLMALGAVEVLSGGPNLCTAGGVDQSGRSETSGIGWVGIATRGPAARRWRPRSASPTTPDAGPSSAT